MEKFVPQPLKVGPAAASAAEAVCLPQVGAGLAKPRIPPLPAFPPACPPAPDEVGTLIGQAPTHHPPAHNQETVSAFHVSSGWKTDKVNSKIKVIELQSKVNLFHYIFNSMKLLKNIMFYNTPSVNFIKAGFGTILKLL